VPSNTFTFSSYLDGLDVDTAGAAQTVVAVGDSITDTGNTPYDSDTRWPNYRAARLSPAGLAVIDQGISGNWVTADQGSSGGPSLSDRWTRDVLDQVGVRTVIDEGGINDLRGGVSATSLESAQSSLISSAHAHGLKIFLTTITPCSGATNCTSSFEAQRQAYNAWVRSGTGAADGYEDFDAAVGNGASLAAMYDSGDHIHPNSAGEQSLADVISTGAL
jgi:lysophospholipase L1-like esterase